MSPRRPRLYRLKSGKRFLLGSAFYFCFVTKARLLTSLFLGLLFVYAALVIRIRWPLKNCVDSCNHPTKVAVKVAARIHWCSIDECKTPETFGELLGLGHVRLSDEDRNSWNALAERSLHLNSNRIGVILNSAMPAFAPSKPPRPDDNEDRISFCHRFLNVNSEILPKWNAIDVYENGLLAKVAGDPIPKAPGKHIRVRATV